MKECFIDVKNTIAKITVECKLQEWTKATKKTELQSPLADVICLSSSLTAISTTIVYLPTELPLGPSEDENNRWLHYKNREGLLLIIPYIINETPGV